MPFTSIHRPSLHNLHLIDLHLMWRHVIPGVLIRFLNNDVSRTDVVICLTKVFTLKGISDAVRNNLVGLFGHVLEQITSKFLACIGRDTIHSRHQIPTSIPVTTDINTPSHSLFVTGHGPEGTLPKA